MVKLVHPDGISTDLRFVPGLHIELAPLPPEIEAEFAELAKFRREWEQYLFSVFGIPADLLRSDGRSAK